MTGENDEGAGDAARRARGKKFEGGGVDEGFEEILDALNEKRATTREEALVQMVKYIVSSQSPDAIYSKRETAVQAFLTSLNTKSTYEGILSCGALSALCVVIGADEEAIFKQIRNKLERIITRSTDEQLRIAALYTLSVGCFICSSVDHDTMEILEFLTDLIQGSSQGEPVEDEMLPAIMESWGLLASTASSRFMKEVAAPSMVPLLAEHLNSSSLAVRLAAGEVLALLHEATKKEIQKEQDPADWRNAPVEVSEDEESDAEQPDAVLDDVWQDVNKQLARLKVESSKRISKRDRKEQRSVFRDIYASIVDGESPEETISFQGGSITVRSWSKYCQVNALRRACQGGFQNQLQVNSVVQQILAEDYEEAVSNVDRKIHYSKTSALRKERSQGRRQQRQARQDHKTQFLDDF